MRGLLFLILGVGLFWACQTETSSDPEKSVQEIKTDGRIKNSDIVRNPVSANVPEDTVNVAKIDFGDAYTYDFGEVDEGAVVSHTFPFTNTGQLPLLIQNARSTCGCTVPDWPKSPISPGEQGTITVRFDTKNKTGRQTKPITITANTYPAVSRIFLTGSVRSADEPVSEEGEPD